MFSILNKRKESSSTRRKIMLFLSEIRGDGTDDIE